jgi:hypothetical protein
LGQPLVPKGVGERCRRSACLSLVTKMWMEAAHRGGHPHFGAQPDRGIGHIMRWLSSVKRAVQGSFRGTNVTPAGRKSPPGSTLIAACLHSSSNRSMSIPVVVARATCVPMIPQCRRVKQGVTCAREGIVGMVQAMPRLGNTLSISPCPTPEAAATTTLGVASWQSNSQRHRKAFPRHDLQTKSRLPSGLAIELFCAPILASYLPSLLEALDNPGSNERGNGAILDSFARTTPPTRQTIPVAVN